MVVKVQVIHGMASGTLTEIRRPTSVIIVISDKKFYFESTNTGKSIAGMNIEHSFPKSWWGGHKNDAWCDLYNLYPSDSHANSSKSNYVMGVVVNVTEEAGAGYDRSERAMLMVSL